MCTVIFDRKLNLLAKNRDKNTLTEEEIVREKDFIAIKTKGSDYYSLGINRFGCAFVSTAVNTPKWTELASQGLVEEASRQAKIENDGLNGPTKILSESLPFVKSVNEWKQLLLSQNLKWKGYHVILVDLENALVLELHKDKMHERKLLEKDFIVNHFTMLEHGPRKYEDYPNTFDRKSYVAPLINKIFSIEDIKEILKPTNLENRKQIWREGCFQTVSSSIISLNDRCIYYAADVNKPYQIIGFSN